MSGEKEQLCIVWIVLQCLLDPGPCVASHRCKLWLSMLVSRKLGSIRHKHNISWQHVWLILARLKTFPSNQICTMPYLSAASYELMEPNSFSLLRLFKSLLTRISILRKINFLSLPTMLFVARLRCGNLLVKQMASCSSECTDSGLDCWWLNQWL